MKTYKVILEETRTYVEEFDANDLEDATNKAHNMVSENEPWEIDWRVLLVEEIENVAV